MIDLQRLIEKAGLVEYQEQLHQIARTMIRLRVERSSDALIQVGASKMGGDPDLPAGFEWPGFEGTPMAFLFQLNLADVGAFTTSRFSSREGMLYFFYESVESHYEDESGRVIYSTARGPQLHRTRNPAAGDGDPCIDEDSCDGIPAGKNFYPCSVAFSEELSLPDLHSPTVWGGVFGKDEAFIDDYWTYKRQLNPHPYDVGLTGTKPKDFTGEQVKAFQDYQILAGKYFDLDQDLEKQGKLYWELAPDDENFYDHHLFGYCQPVQQEPELLPGDQLLLQLDTHKAPGWMWGDMGKLYFWILEPDMRKNEFGNVQVDVQMG